MAYLITGGCGFVGSHLAARLIGRGERVIVLDNLSREGTPANLAWLQEVGEFEFIHGDVRHGGDLERIFAEHAIACVFHLAGQVAMTKSMEDPRRDFEVNVLGSINVLECVRQWAPQATVVYASSNKVYGALEDCSLVELESRYEPAGAKEMDEQTRLDFRTPYGCSKGAADQYMLEYARGFGLNTVVLRHSTIYGGRQRSTIDQGWVGWFCSKARETMQEPQTHFTINGDGKQVRDLLHVSDAVDGYLAAHEHIAEARGQALNIGGGYENSLSLRELFVHLEAQLGVTLNFRQLSWRADDQRYFVADNAKATKYLGWAPKINKTEGIAEVLEWQKVCGVVSR